MRVLIVEDDFAARKLLQTYLRDHADCDVAADGDEAVQAFRLAIAAGEPYDLICLDIMLPKKSGQDVLKEVRGIESEEGIKGKDGVKIFMTSALSDAKNIMEAFKYQCEAYIPKPIKKERLYEEMRNLGLIS
jgi:two-component system chemotaxis response regulator CheY